jgi:glycosyltransferase involved in cell wall biosynthesis
MSHIEELTIVIPALNEETNLRRLLPRIPREICGLKTGVLLVDDGSTDGTAELAKSFDIDVARHATSLGQGAALLLGYKMAVAGGAKIIATMDADGQHLPEEIERLVKPIVDGSYEFVFGSRIKGRFEKDDPYRFIALLMFSQLLSILIGKKITDCSNGFRAMKVNVLEAVVPNLVQKQFDVAELNIMVAKRGFKMAEVPVTVLKRMSGKSKKGNNLAFGMFFTIAMLSTWWREYVMPACKGNKT